MKTYEATTAIPVSAGAAIASDVSPSRRLAAFGIDWAIISYSFAAAGLFAASSFSALGSWGTLVGGLAGICYFGIGSSRMTGGRTIGKWVTGIGVCSTGGNFLSLPAALLRAAILMVPFSVNELPADVLSPGILVVLRSIAMGVGGVTLYLLIFSPLNGRLLHDLATGSIVRRSHSSLPRPAGSTVPRREAVVFIGIVAVAIVLSWVTTARNSDDSNAWRVARRSIRAASAAASVTLWDGLSNENGRLGTQVRAEVVRYVAPKDADALANSIAAIILRDVRVARGRNRIEVTITHGYDLLFVDSWDSRTWSHTPIEWGQRLRQQL